MQGTAADLIKLAMIRMHEALRSGGFRAAMLLQVHDELLFETPPEETDALAALVKATMEDVCRLSVPLAVETSVGDNWRDVK
jgi:DNA polymerase-1